MHPLQHIARGDHFSAVDFEKAGIPVVCYMAVHALQQASYQGLTLEEVYDGLLLTAKCGENKMPLSAEQNRRTLQQENDDLRAAMKPAYDAIKGLPAELKKLTTDLKSIADAVDDKKAHKKLVEMGKDLAALTQQVNELVKEMHAPPDESEIAAAGPVEERAPDAGDKS